MVRAPVCRRLSSTARASAAPSPGSVPVPSSSSSTRRPRLGGGQDGADPAQMPGKGRQARSMLCSSPISARTGANGKSRLPGGARQRQAGPRHQHQQAGGFQRHGLATGVRAAEHQHLVRYRQGAGRSAPRRCRSARSAADAGRPSVPAAESPHSTGMTASISRAKRAIAWRRSSTARIAWLPANASRAARTMAVSSRQDPLFLALHLAQHGLQPVVALQRDGRLDVQGLAAGRDIVDETAQAAGMVGAHRQHVTAVAVGDQRLLEDSGVALVGEQPFELALDPGTHHLHLAAQTGEGRGSTVEDLAARTKGAADGGNQLRQRHQRRSPGPQQRPAIAPGQHFPAGGGRFGRGPHRAEVFGRARRLLRRAARSSSGSRSSPSPTGSGPCSARSCMASAASCQGCVDGRRLSQRPQRQGRVPAGHGAGQAGQVGGNLGKFEQGEAVGRFFRRPCCALPAHRSNCRPPAMSVSPRAMKGGARRDGLPRLLQPGR